MKKYGKERLREVSYTLRNPTHMVLLITAFTSKESTIKVAEKLQQNLVFHMKPNNYFHTSLSFNNPVLHLQPIELKYRSKDLFYHQFSPVYLAYMLHRKKVKQVYTDKNRKPKYPKLLQQMITTDWTIQKNLK